jgi:hypothetical protein
MKHLKIYAGMKNAEFYAGFNLIIETSSKKFLEKFQGKKNLAKR